MPEKLKTCSFLVEIFKARVFVLLGPRESANEWLEKRIGVVEILAPSNAAAAGWYVASNDSRAFYLWLESYDDTDTSRGHLAHEIMHLVFYITNYSGLSLSNDSEEAYGYLCEHLTRQILPRLRKLNA